MDPNTAATPAGVVALLAPLLPIFAALALVVVLRIGNAFVYIPNESYGVIERKWSMGGSSKNRSFMALGAGPGFLPKVVRGGWHFFLPFQYKIHRQQLIVVSQIGYLFARVGETLSEGQTLAMWPEGVDPEDSAAFLNGGGQSGPQRRILRAGTYAINTALFAVLTSDGVHGIGNPSEDKKIVEMSDRIARAQGYDPVVVGQDDVGIITVQDGPSLAHGEIIAPAVGTDSSDPETFHNSYQDVVKFLKAGGRRGRQEQVLVEGTYYINRLFATVETRKKIEVPVGFAGVVVSFTGKTGQDISDANYKQGRLVAKGDRGIWAEALSPGKYAINPYALDVKLVPTTNFQLKWIKGERGGSHGLDNGLSEVELITSDAFEPILPLSIVVHITPENAPYVIQQFGDVAQVVNQSLDPMVSAWFKDAAQKKSLLDLVRDRSTLQAEALESMKVKFGKYRLEVMEVMIGTPRAPVGDTRIESILTQLRDRQVAAEQMATFQSQARAASEQQLFNKAQAAAQQQTALTASEISIQVAENEGSALLKRREKEAGAVKVAAAAERLRVVGEGEAAQILAIGQAKGLATKAQADALGGSEGALRQIVAGMLADAIQHASQPLVPGIVLGGGAGGGGSMLELLTALAVRDMASKENAIHVAGKAA